jgi:RNA polymerase sigma-70 factor (ECF subfamily)
MGRDGPESNGEDNALVEQLRAEDRAAFEHFVRTHEERVRRFCSATLGDGPLGDDAAQETFIKAFRAIRGFKGECSLKTWLLRIARNQCIDLARERGRRHGRAVADGDEQLSHVGDTGPSAAHSIHARDHARRMLELLPEKDRELLVQCHGMGISYAELSEIHEGSLDAVKGRLKRARKAAIEILRHLVGGDNVSTPEDEHG